MKRAGLIPLLAACAVAQGCAGDSGSASVASGATIPPSSAAPTSDTGTGELPPDVPRSAGEPRPATATVPVTNRPAPLDDDRSLAITAELVGGGMFDGADYLDRPVVLWFWGPV